MSILRGNESLHITIPTAYGSNNICEFFKESTESEAVKNHWKLIGYCEKQRMNITNGICNICKFKPTSKEL